MAQQTCPTCGGRGAVSNGNSGSPELCPNCGGAGTISVGTDDLPFWYPFLPSPYGSIPTLVIVAANGQQAGLVQIANDSDFLWDRIVAVANGNFSVLLKDEFSARPLMPFGNVPIVQANIAGTGQLPFWLPKAYLLRRTSTISAQFTDLSGAPNNAVQMVLVGYKVS